VASLATPAAAKEVTVRMLNKGAGGAMVFEPALVKIAPGDSVRFVATDKTHNAESIPSMVPPGGTTFKGKINQDVTATFSKPGLYGVKCLPHYSLGMVSLVQVGGASPNLASARAEAAKLPGLAKKRMAPLVAQAK
jgi:pseudoazurin